jgi:hypothetical protein
MRTSSIIYMKYNYIEIREGMGQTGLLTATEKSMKIWFLESTMCLLFYEIFKRGLSVLEAWHFPNTLHIIWSTGKLSIYNLTTNPHPSPTWEDEPLPVTRDALSRFVGTFTSHQQKLWLQWIISWSKYRIIHLHQIS